MKISTCFTALAVCLLAAGSVLAQTANDERQEFAVTAGELSGSNPSTGVGGLSLNPGIAVEANFARRIRDLSFGSVYWEVDGLTGPLRSLEGTQGAATHQIRSVFVTPGLKLQFTPKETVSPWIAAGAGYAFYSSSGTSIAGSPITVGNTNTYAVDFGGGVDFALGKRYLLRAMLRGIHTGAPDLGVPTSGGQFNFMIGGGFVWRFPK